MIKGLSEKTRGDQDSPIADSEAEDFLCSPSSSRNLTGFTLVELLVSIAILAMLLVLLLSMVTHTSKIWRVTKGKIEEFSSAQIGFDTITRRLGQATLNPYIDYVTNANGVVTGYMRQSQLRILSGPTATILAPMGSPTTTNPTMGVFFQAPNGLTTNNANSLLVNALNTWGYYIEYAGDTNNRPSFLPGLNSRYRYRLMELMEPTENLSIYNYTSGNNGYTNIDWISNSMALPAPSRPAHVLAENVIALILLPKLSPNDMGTTYNVASLAPNYIYDSSQTNNNSTNGMLNPHNQLPPMIQVTLVAVDETSAVRFASNYSQLCTSPAPKGYANLFTDASQFTNDLSTLGSILSANHLSYRIFTTDIILRAAKWSSAQTN